MKAMLKIQKELGACGVMQRSGPNTPGSLMVYSLLPVTLPSSALQKQLKKRMNSTLAIRSALAPTYEVPNYQPISVQKAAGAAMVSMLST